MGCEGVNERRKVWSLGGGVLNQHCNHETLGLRKLADNLQSLQGHVSRQHQGELMQFAWLKLPDVFSLDFGEATHECAVCHHLSVPFVVENSVAPRAATPVIPVVLPFISGGAIACLWRPCLDLQRVAVEGGLLQR